jgi:sec-independent protein translocase protein TatA
MYPVMESHVREMQLRQDELHLQFPRGDEILVNNQNRRVQEDKMFGFSPFAIIIILLLILVIFGAGKLPEIGSSLGKGIKNFKRSFEGKDEIEIKSDKDDDEKKGS